jgi:hypothetical protein
MPNQQREVSPGPKPQEVRTAEGVVLTAPTDWILLPPGDAALSRRVKAGGPCWVVKEKRGRKLFSRGIWAPKERIESLRQELELERTDPAYQRKLDAGRKRRDHAQEVYAGDFEAAVLRFLDFEVSHLPLARKLAAKIAQHAVPVGSGTVARTQRIPIEKRAEAATIAWMRHQTTAYDELKIPRVKGMRREVRRQLAQHSKQLLARYRRGAGIELAACPLQRALAAG